MVRPRVVVRSAWVAVVPGALARGRRPACLGVLVGALVATGCEGPELEPGPESGDGWLLLGTLDTHHFCDRDAVVEVQLRAQWQDCASVEPDCEAPEATVIEGDRYTCPATDAHYDLGVSLTHPGRYRVEAVAELTTGEEQPECFVDPQSQLVGDVEIELPSTRLSGPSPVVLDEHGPCP